MTATAHAAKDTTEDTPLTVWGPPHQETAEPSGMTTYFGRLVIRFVTTKPFGGRRIYRDGERTSFPYPQEPDAQKEWDESGE